MHAKAVLQQEGGQQEAVLQQEDGRYLPLVSMGAPPGLVVWELHFWKLRNNSAVHPH
jgi:hypothetical protein